MKLDPFPEQDRDIRVVFMWAPAVLRRMVDVGKLVKRVLDEGRKPSLQESIDIVGDAAQAVVALNAALSAVDRYLTAHPGVEGPMPASELDYLRGRARQFRNAVEHLHEKMALNPQETEMRVEATRGVIMVAPPGLKGATVETSEILWTEMESAARKMLRWVAAIAGEGAT